MIKKLRNKIASLPVYMPSGEPKRYVGTDLADEIGTLIEKCGYMVVKAKKK